MKNIFLFIVLAFTQLHAASDTYQPETMLTKSIKFTQEDPYAVISLVTAAAPIVLSVGMLFGASSFEECITYGVFFVVSYAVSFYTEGYAKTKDAWLTSRLNLLRRLSNWVGVCATVLKGFENVPGAGAQNLRLEARNCTVPNPSELGISKVRYDTLFSTSYITELKQDCLERAADNAWVIHDNVLGFFKTIWEAENENGVCVPVVKGVRIFVPTCKEFKVKVIDSLYRIFDYNARLMIRTPYIRGIAY